MRTTFEIMTGSATIEIHPPLWWSLTTNEANVEHGIAAVRALWGAHPCVLSVTVGSSRPPIAVEIAIPKDGSLDIVALQHDLEKRIRAVLPGLFSCQPAGKGNA